VPIANQQVTLLRDTVKVRLRDCVDVFLGGSTYDLWSSD
jgi:hypothetical protein